MKSPEIEICICQVGFEDMLQYSTSQVLERLFALPSLDHLCLARRCLVSFKANTMEVTAFISNYVIQMLQKGFILFAFFIYAIITRYNNLIIVIIASID